MPLVEVLKFEMTGAREASEVRILVTSLRHDVISKVNGHGEFIFQASSFRCYLTLHFALEHKKKAPFPF